MNKTMIMACLAALSVACSKESATKVTDSAAKPATSSTESRQNDQTCSGTIDEVMARYKSALKADNSSLKLAQWVAYCSDARKEPELLKIAQKVDYEEKVERLSDTGLTTSERIALLHELEVIEPDNQKFKKERESLMLQESKLAADAKRRAEKERLAAERQLAKEKRSQGVSIGMTKEEALASSWGRPKSKNVHASSYGVTEQWVYGGQNYLYFRDGVLTDVQIGH
jgi:hypothetical protein